MKTDVTIVDVYDNADNIDVFIDKIKHLSETSCDNNHYRNVYFLTPSKEIDLPDDIPSQRHLTITRIGGGNRVESFYKAKRKLDDNGVENVIVLCCKSAEAYWKRVCSTVFTPLHTWLVDTVTCKVNVPVDVASVVSEVKDMLKTLPSQGEVSVLKTSLIPADLFIHGYSTRSGGITTIPTLSGLNLLYTPRKRDSLLAVQENLRRFGQAAEFDPERYHVTRTNHGCRVWKTGTEIPEKYDAIVTNEPGLTIAAAGADCTQILFVDPVKRVSGAAHAGYRGTLKRVAINTIDALVDEYGSDVSDILVTMGPTVCAACFTLDSNSPAVEDFKAIGQSTVELHREGDVMKVGCNLVTANRVLLEQRGVHPLHIDTTHAVCTACHPDRFFSCERDGFPFGNQIGFVTIRRT